MRLNCTENTQKTTNHDTIKAWVEERGGRPAKVETNDDANGGILRIDFAGGDDEKLDHISWGEFFEIFDENDLAFMYQDETAKGEASRFNKFVSG